MKISGIAESCLYVDDVVRSVDFYTGLFGFPVIREEDRFSALRVAPGQVLLLFHRGASKEAMDLGFGTIIGHDGSGPLHLCFGIGAGEVAKWTGRLEKAGIALESRVDWPAGAVSLYFRDPDGHALELATPGLWEDEQGI